MLNRRDFVTTVAAGFALTPLAGFAARQERQFDVTLDEPHLVAKQRADLEEFRREVDLFVREQMFVQEDVWLANLRGKVRELAAGRFHDANVEATPNPYVYRIGVQHLLNGKPIAAFSFTDIGVFPAT